MHLSVKSETRNVTVRFRVGIRMTTNKSIECSNAPQETATDCGDVSLQAIMSTVELFANKCIALNHEWNITGNYAVRMHKPLKHQCVHYNCTKISRQLQNTYRKQQRSGEHPAELNVPRGVITYHLLHVLKSSVWSVNPTDPQWLHQSQP